MRSSVARSDTLRVPAAAELVAHQARDRGALDRAQVVDDALGVALVGARRAVVVAGQVRDASAGRRRSARRWSARARAARACPAGCPRRGAGRSRAASSPPAISSAAISCARGPVFSYMKRPGVGDQADVERLADRRRDRHAEAVHQVPHHLGRARGVRVDVVDRPEARVVVVVVDVDDQRAVVALEHLGRGAVDVAAVQEDQRALGEVRGRLGRQPLELDEAVLVRAAGTRRRA